MSARLKLLAALVMHFHSFVRWRSMLLALLMIVAALSEGVGLLMLVPLLTLVGLRNGETADSDLISGMVVAADRVGASLSLDLVLAVFVILVIVRQLVIYIGARLAAHMRIEYVASIRNEFFAALGETNWRFLSGGRLDQVSQILLTDCWRIGEAALKVIRILSSAVLLLANVIVAVLLAPLLALSLLGSISLLTLLFGNRLRLVQEQGGKLSQIHTDVLRLVENYVNNLRTAKMAGAIGQMQNEFGMKIDELGAEVFGFAKATEATKMTLQVIAAIAVAVALLIAVHGFGASGPVLLLLVFITARFISRLTVLSQTAHSLFYDLPAFEHAYDVLYECRAHRDLSQASGARLIAKNSIGLRNVRVVSDDGSGKAILDGVSLQIATGEFLAIVGPSGAGKSTLADVLSGLSRPDSGELLIDDNPLDDRRVLDWRHSVGYVSQAAALLQDTIEHNLNWVLPEPATELELERALRCAQISHLAGELPEGLGTIIDRREGMLSGGERQRLAIARELLRQPQLLILDEATSALDVDNEALVLDNIRRYYATMTVVLITHRSTAIDRADRVVHIVDGKIELSRDRVAISC